MFASSRLSIERHSRLSMDLRGFVSTIVRAEGPSERNHRRDWKRIGTVRRRTERKNEPLPPAHSSKKAFSLATRYANESGRSKNHPDPNRDLPPILVRWSVSSSTTFLFLPLGHVHTYTRTHAHTQHVSYSRVPLYLAIHTTRVRVFHPEPLPFLLSRLGVLRLRRSISIRRGRCWSLLVVVTVVVTGRSHGS